MNQVFQFETVTVNDLGQIIARETCTAQQFTEDLGGGVILEMVAVPAASSGWDRGRARGTRTSGRSTA